MKLSVAQLTVMHLQIQRVRDSATNDFSIGDHVFVYVDEDLNSKFSMSLNGCDFGADSHPLGL